MSFHQRGLVSHNNKLAKANTAKSRSKTNVVNIRENSRSPLKSIVNNDASRMDKIEHYLSELKDLICTHFQSDNKHVEKYNSVISEQSATKPNEAKRLSKNNKHKKKIKKIEKIQYRSE